MKTLTTTTHIGTVRKDNLSQLIRICSILGWSHDEYCRHQFGEYELFIRRLCCEAPHLVDSYRYSKMFRGFYNQEWTMRNAGKFLPLAEESLQWVNSINPKGELVSYPGAHEGDELFGFEYKKIHSVHSLFSDSEFEMRCTYIIDKILTQIHV